jgi:hypothetical protein
VIEFLLPLASHFLATSQFNNIDKSFSSPSCLPQNHPAITTTRQTHPIPRKRVEMATPQRRCVATPANRTILTFAKSKMPRPLLPLNLQLSLLPLVFVNPLCSLMIYGRAPVRRQEDFEHTMAAREYLTHCIVGLSALFCRPVALPRKITSKSQLFIEPLCNTCHTMIALIPHRDANLFSPSCNGPRLTEMSSMPTVASIA